MAKPKTKGDRAKPPTPIERKRDLEALSLLSLGLAVASGVAIYTGSRLAGGLGASLQTLLWGNLGVVAWLIPPALAILGGLLLLDRPLGGFVRTSGLIFAGGVVALPLVAHVSKPHGGTLGTLSHGFLLANLGPLGLLLPMLALSVVADLALRQRPGYLLGRGARRVALAGHRLVRAFRLAQGATRLQVEARALAERYPEHKALHTLGEDLERFRKAPRDEAELAGFAGVLEGFRAERARELAEKLQAEVRPLPARLERLAAALAAPLKGEGLAQALEERRAALLLEINTLQAKTQTLIRQTDQAAKGLGHPSTKSLLEAWDAHSARQEEWRKLEGLTGDLEARVDAWLRWAEWAEAAPTEAQPAGLRALLERGLSTDPPAFEVATAKPEPVIDFDFVFPEPESKEKVSQSAIPVLEVKPLAQPKPSSPQPAPVPSRKNSTALALPGFDLLDKPEPPKYDPRALEASTRRQVDLINETLKHHGVEAKVVSWSRGPTVTRFELEPAPGEKISRVQNLHNDLALALAAGSVRIEAPIPGKSVIGLEVPNTERELVRYSEAIQSSAFARSKDTLPMVLGKSIDGEVWVKDLARMPHLLIAGSTGSGKSVAVNTLITSLLFKYLPTELRFLMIDPKMVELTPYEGIPHLVRPVVTNPADAAGVLLGAVAHMERRYKMLSQVGARNLEQFNQKMKLAGEPTLPYLVIVIDELADLMITAPKEVEQAILRLAQMARATGMHLILATQRPSVDILTSLIKVNVPARMAFAVSSGFDSRTILDTYGAERLVGQGDMLFHQPGLPKPVRLQGPFLSETEVHRIAEFLRTQSFEDAFAQQYASDFEGPLQVAGEGGGSGEVDFGDPLLKKAAEIVIEEGYASVSRLQRRLSVGHARAGKLVDALEAMGIVGPHQGSKPRDVLITRDQLPEYFGGEA
ncbi:DNA translocase FtsK [Meiothermus granaticius]|uniref:DNA translocase FtsK n=1 Tax=Meiothermus granaticius NBRC 107808 TaxID=1227551 RepID=A0A399FDQ0_9DEIN|nr:DNA translocase FtsK [Meiothermus granaticius]RIH92971.1 DNA translocase FtsK [Meiothermus granaticius NBRC 107808]GEM86191.1 DNA translocase FtsK [Meiothermus granaticius NBRC 107808]